jgi:FixJ family two-component response regulator
MQIERCIYLVDDDEAVCHALSVFLEASGYRVMRFASAEAFLDGIGDTVEGIMLLDQRMTGMTGLDLQTELAKRGIDLPIIFVTGHGDVHMSVKAIKAGAINFLEKPFSNEELLTSIREAFALADDSQQRTNRIEQLKGCLASLTEREREVMEHVVAGKSNRHIAELLGVSGRTIEVHRARAMKKMGAKTLPDLVRKCAQCL